MNSVLVTGGAGFLGSHLVDHLVDHGYNVTVIDNLTEQVHDGKPEYLNDEAEYVWGDIRDRDLMSDLLVNTDVLSHQASVVGVGQSMYEIEHYVEVNTLATARILDIIVEEDIDLEKLVVASSMSVYGEGAYKCPECGVERHPDLRDDEQLSSADWEIQCPKCSTGLEPEATPESKPRESTSVYAITKQDQEELCRSVGRAYSIPTVSLRYFNVYGSRQALENPYTGVCAIFSSRIQNDNQPLIFEDGQQTRDFIHVSDIARANRLAIERDVSDAAINIGSGEPKTITRIATTLIDLYGKAELLEPKIAEDYRQGDIRHCYADTTKAKKLLAFEPEINFEDGMRELVNWGCRQDAEDHFDEAHAELHERGLVGED
jgi:dTDP-L-rhamnose 4-epimerase